MQVVDALLQRGQTLRGVFVVGYPFFDVIDAAADRCRPPHRAEQMHNQRRSQCQQRKGFGAHAFVPQALISSAYSVAAAAPPNSRALLPPFMRRLPLLPGPTRTL